MRIVRVCTVLISAVSITKIPKLTAALDARVSLGVAQGEHVTTLAKESEIGTGFKRGLNKRHQWDVDDETADETETETPEMESVLEEKGKTKKDSKEGKDEKRIRDKVKGMRKRAPPLTEEKRSRAPTITPTNTTKTKQMKQKKSGTFKLKAILSHWLSTLTILC
jgi:hypothetical protein